MSTRYKLFFLFLMAMATTVFAQPAALSERKKVRYLKKIEKKNNRYIIQQEKKTDKLLTRLTAKETALHKGSDSTRLDSTLIKNSFSKIKKKLTTATAANPEEILTKIAQPINIDHPVSFNLIPENADGEIKDYLKQQIITTEFLNDSTCQKCKKLKKQTAKVKQNISKTAAKLERLKIIETDIEKHQETLKKYGVNTPALKSKLKEIEKNCFYYKQGTGGFKKLYTNPAKGIENKLLKNLSFNKNFTAFQSKFNSLQIPALSGTGIPDLSGYQTKAQVQAMLPQNAPGIGANAKTQLINNMQNSLTKFTELRNEKPDLSMFKDKPTFKINPYKGLPLRQRLAPSFTFQPQIKTQHEPITINLGATLGFKLTERLTPMIGAFTKVGLGKDIHHLLFSYEGIGLRSGMDVKLFYGFSFQAWYEAMWKPYNYLVQVDHAVNYPKPSFITGICNTYQISKKVKGTFMIGYDFFYNKHTPYTSPWVIRMGWQ